MGSFSDYLESKILDHVLGAATFVPPSTVYFALYTVTPDDAGGGVEVSGGGYARVAVPNNGTNFPPATGDTPTLKANGTSVMFPASGAATSSWGTVVAMAVYDAATGGNELCWAALAIAKTIDVGDTATFGVGAFTLTLD